MKKSKSNLIHSQRRMQQRYGLRLSKDRRRRILEEIRLGKGECKRISCSRSRWTIYLEKENIDVTVVYDRDRKSIVTVLPT